MLLLTHLNSKKMTVYCSVSSSAPAETNNIMGYIDQKNYYLDLSTASASDKKIVNDFLAIIGTHISVELLDYTEEIQVETNIIIPGETDLETITIEYPSLATTKKGKVDAYINLLKSLVTTN